MTCKVCETWAATTREQLNNRVRNKLMQPGPTPFECEACGGTDWMLTEDYIRPDRSGLMRYRWYRVLYATIGDWLLRREYRGFEKIWAEEGVAPDEIKRARTTIDSFITKTYEETVGNENH